MTRYFLSMAAIMAATSCLSAPAVAAERVELGVLECSVEGGASFVFGSSRQLQCTFYHTDQAIADDKYTGTIKKFGLDLGSAKNTLIRWAVVAPTFDAYSPGALTGGYVGATASASIAVGLGANVLVGGLDKSFALQPVSVQTQEGINVAVGIASLELQSGMN